MSNKPKSISQQGLALNITDDHTKGLVPVGQSEDLTTLRNVVIQLYKLLDDIDTASDMFKPRDESSYKAFYEYTMRRQQEKANNITTDGFEIYIK